MSRRNTAACCRLSQPAKHSCYSACSRRTERYSVRLVRAPSSARLPPPFSSPMHLLGETDDCVEVLGLDLDHSVFYCRVAWLGLVSDITLDAQSPRPATLSLALVRVAPPRPGQLRAGTSCIQGFQARLGGGVLRVY